MNIGIFGGTFDPPHIGHLIAAQDACAALSLDRLLFIPAADPPHKRGERVSEATLRLAMLRAALADNRQFEISTIELERQGPSYTVDTLRQLHEQYAGDALFLLLGVDQIREFSTWREPQQVLQLAHVVMLTRAGQEQVHEDFVQAVVPVTRVDVSSTLVRERVAKGQPFRYFVTAAVADIIEANRLYLQAEPVV